MIRRLALNALFESFNCESRQSREDNPSDNLSDVETNRISATRITLRWPVENILRNTEDLDGEILLERERGREHSKKF